MKKRNPKKHNVHEVHICKPTRYCKILDVIPEVFCNDRDEVINLPEVKKAMDAVHEKKFIVIVYSNGANSHLEYKIERV